MRWRSEVRRLAVALAAGCAVVAATGCNPGLQYVRRGQVTEPTWRETRTQPAPAPAPGPGPESPTRRPDG
jgi:hypothetical protein